MSGFEKFAEMGTGFRVPEGPKIEVGYPVMALFCAAVILICGALAVWLDQG